MLEFALNSSLRAAFEDRENPDFNRINALIEEARTQGVALDGTTLGFALKKTIRRLSEQFLDNPNNIGLMKKLEGVAGLARNLPFEVNVWRAQNNYYRMLQETHPGRLAKAMAGDTSALEWVEHFAALGRNLSVKVDVPGVPELQMAA